MCTIQRIVRTIYMKFGVGSAVADVIMHTKF